MVVVIKLNLHAVILQWRVKVEVLLRLALEAAIHNYRFLLLTKLVCADDQSVVGLHTDEAKVVNR